MIYAWALSPSLANPRMSSCYISEILCSPGVSHKQSSVNILLFFGRVLGDATRWKLEMPQHFNHEFRTSTPLSSTYTQIFKHFQGRLLPWTIHSIHLWSAWDQRTKPPTHRLASGRWDCSPHIKWVTNGGPMGSQWKRTQGISNL